MSGIIWRKRYSKNCEVKRKIEDKKWAFYFRLGSNVINCNYNYEKDFMVLKLLSSKWRYIKIIKFVTDSHLSFSLYQTAVPARKIWFSLSLVQATFLFDYLNYIICSLSSPKCQGNETTSRQKAHFFIFYFLFHFQIFFLLSKFPTHYHLSKKV